MTTVPASSADTRSTNLSIWSATLLAAVGAVVVNVLLFLVGKAAGVDFVVTEAGTETELTVGVIIGASLIPMLVGAVVAGLTVPRWPVARTVLQIVGAVLAVGTVVSPLVADASTGTRVLLAVMHVVLGAFYVPALALARRDT